MSPQDRRTLRVGVVGFLVAVTLILGAWRVVSSDLPDFRAAAAVPSGTPSSEPTVTRSPSETFVVPSPPPVTQTPSESPTSSASAPADPTSAGPAPAAAVADAPSTPAARDGQPPRSQPGPSTPQVRNVDLSCAQQGKRVAASLTFQSERPVAVSLTAGGRTETSGGNGAVRMHVSGPGDQGAQCSAVVDGRPVGPISAGSHR